MARHGKKLKKGSMLGPYRIIRLIGEGGMGEVYQAHDEVLNRPVALKVISPKIYDVKEIVKRFMSEGQALARLNHHNVVVVYTLGEEAGTHYIVMEYVDGASLHDILKARGPLSIDDALQCFGQLLDGVKALHESGIIHRDLKPKNIIVRRDNSVKIVDFGIAKIEGQAEQELTSTGEMVGSVYYVAPEVVEGEPATIQSDIWSLGINLYEMLIGRNPWEADNWGAVVKKITEDELPFPNVKNKVPEALRRLILKMCEKKASRRYETIDEVIIDLQAFKNGEKLVSAPSLYHPADHTMVEVRSDNTSHSLKIPNRTATAVRSSSGKQMPVFFAILVALGAGAWYFLQEGEQSAKTSQVAKSNSKNLNPVSPTSGQKIWIGAQDKVGFEWKGEHSGAVTLEIAKDLNFREIVIAETAPALPYQTNELTDGYYYWRLVQKSGRQKDQLVEPIGFTVVTQTAPQLIYPISHVVTAEAQPIKFYWQEKPGASAYRFQMATDSSFETMVSDQLMSETQTSPLTPSAGDYFWRVRAEDHSAAFSMWSEVRGVRVQKMLVPQAGNGKNQKLAAPPPLAPPPAVIAKNQARNQRPVPPPAPVAAAPKKGPEPKAVAVKNETQQIQTPTVLQSSLKQILNFKPGKNPRNPASGDGPLNPPVLSWSKVAGASSYEVQVSKNSKFSRIDWKKSVPTEQVKWESAQPGKYFWRVRAVGANQSGSAFTSANSMELNIAAPRVRRTYSHKIEGKSSPASVDWESIPFAAGYRVLVSSNSEFQPVKLNLKADRAVASLPLSAAGTYYVKVAPLSASGEQIGDFSQVATLNIEKSTTVAMVQKISGAPPKLKLPPNGISIVSLTGNPDPITFRWESISGAESYRLEVAADERFTKILHTEVLKDSQVVITKNFPKGKGFWRVRTESKASRSDWSPVFLFEIEK